MAMKNPYEVLLAKEAELTRIKEEVRSLHIAIPLLREDGNPEPPKESSKPCSVISGIPDDPELEGLPDPTRRRVYFRVDESCSSKSCSINL
jgi:hypothetical protein